MRSLFNSFNAKVLGLALLAVAGSQIATVLAVLVYAEREVATRADDELQKAQTRLTRTLEHRADALADAIRPLVRSPGFQDALRTGDRQGINDRLLPPLDQSGADIALLLDSAGAVVAAFGDEALARSSYAELLENRREMLFTDQSAYEMLSLPVEAPDTIGWVSIGYRVTDNLAGDLAQAAAVDLTLLRTSDSGRISILGSSLPPAERELMLSASEQVAAGATYLQATEEVSEYFRTARQPYLTADSRVVMLLHKRIDDARQPFLALRGAMLHAASLSLIGALVLAVFLSRAVTKPMRALLEAARRMSIGNYSQQLTLSSHDEFGELAQTFEAMRTGIAEREQRIVYQAEYDDLTGLPNRLQATEKLRNIVREAGRTGRPAVVMVMHLRRFREIQSSLGHEIGDEVLRQIAQRLRAALDARLVLARLEGDQFLIVAPDADEEEGKRIADDIAGLVDAGMNVQSVNVTMDACIGFCVCPEHGRQADELLRRAAVAKNDAQRAQKRIRMYQNGREARHVRQLAILGDLRRATRNNELELHLQPKVNLRTNKVCGAEALLRWHHPELGQIPPFEFIPLAERAGCIGMVTQWVLSRAIAQCRSWRDQGIELPIAVNFSAQDLMHDNMVPMIEHELQANDMDASCLICEITEEAVVHDLEHAINVINRLRAIGARTSMDDFGTGYSSLSNLQNLPVDELKIDRAFVMQLPGDPQSAAIARAIIDLAHNLNLEVVAEGVETIEGLRWLRNEGCERAQGYYLSKPMPATEFVSWLRNWEQSNHDEFSADEQFSDSVILRPRLIT